MTHAHNATPPKPSPDDLRGVGVALAVYALWAISLVPAALLPLTITPLHLAGGVALILLRTFLCTGIFITAHDAMHGLAAPGHPRLNDALGALCTRSYAGFSFGELRAAHHRHHDTPARDGDPDWHDGTHPGFWRWLLAFGGRYMRWSQIVIIAIAHNIGVRLLGVPEPQMWVFVWLPAVLSALQLFTFGTWMPHREPVGGHTNPHAARSSGFPPWLSFVTCYHFGYHLTHHAFPWIPWWRLPTGRRALVASERTPTPSRTETDPGRRRPRGTPG